MGAEMLPINFTRSSSRLGNCAKVIISIASLNLPSKYPPKFLNFYSLEKIEKPLLGETSHFEIQK